MNLAGIRERVRREGLAGVVTTEKDAVKIPAAWLGDVRCGVVEVDRRFLSGQGGSSDLESPPRSAPVSTAGPVLPPAQPSLLTEWRG